jgi:signal peptide peptidase SppA
MILPEAHRSVGKLVQSFFEKEMGNRWSMTNKADVQNASRGIDLFTERPLPQMQIRNGIALIPCHGVLARGVSQIEKSCGITDVEDIQRDLDEVENAKGVDLVVLDVDSPGGMHNGSTELAYRLAEYGKETLAWVPGGANSAAYNAACSCDSIWAAPSAQVGCIGSYIAILDESRAYEMQGLKMEVFKSSEIKGAGVPGTALTDAQREYFQSIVDQATEQFTSHVKAMRPKVQADSMDGRTFFAKDAFQRGLINGVENSLEAVLKQVR